jgi:starvation-inducible DNA-binding protein
MANSKMIDGLNGTIASATVFYQKLRAFHWMVKGPQFFELHGKFEEIYDRWADVIDELAERVVQLGGTPPLTLTAVLKGTKLQEELATPDARGMVSKTIADLRTQQDAFRQLIATAEEHNDRTTANLLDGVVDETDKTIWMLSAFSVA